MCDELSELTITIPLVPSVILYWI